jgi:plastocyanin
MAFPGMYVQGALAFAQNGAQPCYLDSGAPPRDAGTPCAKRSQPAFTGTHSFYSSGIIPYEGQPGNQYRLPIAASAAPGTHYYYCNLHGPLMSGAITVVAKDAPTQAEVNTQAQKEIKKYIEPLSAAYKDALAGKATPKGYLAGLDGGPNVSAELAEFVPRSIKAKVGEKVTWHVTGGAHTVSFNVPKYLPEVVIGKDGKVSYNDQVIKPVGGPGFPAPPDEGPPSGPPGPPPPTVNIDAGNYDGGHFLSSGLGFGYRGEAIYSLAFTKAGTYKYACLVHPQMIGEVVVG